jgi:ribosomal protein L37AE/L43A
MKTPKPKSSPEDKNIWKCSDCRALNYGNAYKCGDCAKARTIVDQFVGMIVAPAAATK